jgi:hypothetical protein
MIETELRRFSMDAMKGISLAKGAMEVEPVV